MGFGRTALVSPLESLSSNTQINPPYLFISGLISDSFHMFFDCTGLLAGLAASVITKWKANDKYSYGYVRAEVLAGFVNSLFLLFISFFILSESVERLIEPPEVSHCEILYGMSIK